MQWSWLHRPSRCSINFTDKFRQENFSIHHFTLSTLLGTGCSLHSSVSKTEDTAPNPMSINSPGTLSALQTVPCSHLASQHPTVSTSANKDSSTQRECLQAGSPMSVVWWLESLGKAPPLSLFNSVWHMKIPWKLEKTQKTHIAPRVRRTEKIREKHRKTQPTYTNTPCFLSAFWWFQRSRLYRQCALRCESHSCCTPSSEQLPKLFKSSRFSPKLRLR